MSPPVRVGQTLHGYEDGHRLLAGSSTWAGVDARTLLINSDVSGPNASLPVTGYVTGYPLPEAGRYALARTWPAPEMDRPGCVWTHTLLVDFADLAGVEHPSELARLFRRPSGAGERSAYTFDLTFRPEGRAVALGEGAPAEPLLEALYDHPDEAVLAPSDAAAEAAALALWDQQWPRLRRGFRFCSWSEADRSSEEAVFDLQLLPPRLFSRKPKWRAAYALPENKVGEPEPWLTSAAQDLRKGGSELRRFLRRSGADIRHGRRGFKPLCEIHEVIRRPGSRGLTRAVEVAQAAASGGEGQALLTHVAETVLARLGEADQRSLRFTVDNLPLVESNLTIERRSELADGLWRHDRERLWGMFEQGGLPRQIAETKVAHLSPAEVLKDLGHRPALLQDVIEFRPALAEGPEVWRAGAGAVEALLRADFSTADRPAVLHAMLAAEEPGLGVHAVERFGAQQSLSIVLDALDRAQGRLTPTYSAWITASAGDNAAITRALRVEIGKRATLAALARVLAPADPQTPASEDPWLAATRRARGEVSARDANALNAFLAARALGRWSPQPVELLAATFDALAEELAHDTLGDEAWRRLERLVPGYTLFDVDRMRRFATAVGGALAAAEPTPSSFLGFTRFDDLFSILVAAVGGSPRGRDYLKRVRRALKDSGTPKEHPRIRALDRVL